MNVRFLNFLVPNKRIILLAGLCFIVCIGLSQENNSILCSDGIDNDGDGDFDCDDSDCQAIPNMGCITCFNDGLSFADFVIEYNQTCGDTNQFTIPEMALGVADDTGIPGGDRYVSLGDGGSIKLGFDDNLIINSGDDAPDIWVFEIGSAVESMTVELRAADAITITELNNAGVLDDNGDGFYAFGSIMGSTSSIDIDELVPVNVMGILKFNAIEITDIPSLGCESASPGADIDAVCALSSVSSEICDNGIDDDLDGFIDCDDPQLAGDCCCLTTNTIDLGPDLRSCFGDTFILEVQDIFDEYEWNTGIREPRITVTQSGLYSVTVTETNNCQLFDDISITIQDDPIIKEILFKCPEEMISVRGLQVDMPGIYRDTVLDPLGICDSFFRFDVRDFTLNESFLGPDQLICGREFNLTSNLPNTIFPNGVSGTSLLVETNQQLIATAVDTSGCAVTDTININFVNLGTFYIPSVFSPNNDGINDVFELYFDGDNILVYELTVFNRWGGEVFRNAGTNVGWDGTSSGKLSPNGSYVYSLTYESESCEIAESYSGSLLLIR